MSSAPPMIPADDRRFIDHRDSFLRQAPIAATGTVMDLDQRTADEASVIVEASPKVRWSNPCNELFAALSAAQAEMKNAARDSDNPYFNSSYTGLGAVWDAIREPLTKHGLAVMQPATSEGALNADGTTRLTVTTLLTHKSGQWMASELTLTVLPMPRKRAGDDEVTDTSLRKVTPQAVGSVITYARRYALMGVAGIAPEDDDGETGEGRGEQHPRKAVVVCPKCGKPGTIIQGKAEFGGGWLCWRNRGGCGAKFATDPAVQAPDDPKKGVGRAQDETEEQRHERAVRLFKDTCKVTGLTPLDVTDYLRETLGAEDLESVDDFSKITKLNLVWDANQKKPGSGAALVLEKAQRWRASHVPDGEDPQPAPKSKRGAATPEPFMSLYGRVGAKAGRDGLNLLSEYLDREMGHHKIMGLVDGTQEGKRFRNLLESLAGMEIQQLRSVLLGPEHTLDLQPEEAEVV